MVASKLGRNYKVEYQGNIDRYEAFKKVQGLQTFNCDRRDVIYTK